MKYKVKSKEALKSLSGLLGGFRVPYKVEVGDTFDFEPTGFNAKRKFSKLLSDGFIKKDTSKPKAKAKKKK